jgi:hypothetical protein
MNSSLLPSSQQPPRAEPSYPETRTGLFGLPVETSTEVSAFVSDGGQRTSTLRSEELTADLGLFTQEDPIRFQDGLSPYAYVRNRPSLFFDPDGFCPWTVRRRPTDGLGADDITTYHWYFYNEDTGQSIGLGPVKPPAGAGKYETKETPKKTPFDGPMGRVPDKNCDCVDKAVKQPGKPPVYCPFPGGGFDWNPRNLPPINQCQNCQTWVRDILVGCGVTDPGPYGNGK